MQGHSSHAESLSFHEIASIFPLMGPDELQQLADDIREHGQREAIVLFEGKVLDGRNRAAACRLAGIEPRTQEFDGTAIEAIAFVWSENFHRRHLDKSQAAMAEAERLAKDGHYRDALERLSAEREQKKKEQAHRGKEGGRGKRKTHTQPVAEGFSAGGGSDGYAPYLKTAKSPTEEQREKRRAADKRTTAEQRAKLAGTSRQYVSDADKVLREAPDLAEKVKEGKLKLSQAKLELKRRQKREALQQAEQAPIETTWRIINDDCLNALQEIDAGTVRLMTMNRPAVADGRGAFTCAGSLTPVRPKDPENPSVFKRGQEAMRRRRRAVYWLFRLGFTPFFALGPWSLTPKGLQVRALSGPLANSCAAMVCVTHL